MYHGGMNQAERTAVLATLKKTRLSVSTCSSFRLSVAEIAVARVKRKKYGEKYDAVHPGGFTNMDFSEISDNLWNFMLGPLRVKPFVDMGCGKGTIWT